MMPVSEEERRLVRERQKKERERKVRRQKILLAVLSCILIAAVITVILLARSLSDRPKDHKASAQPSAQQQEVMQSDTQAFSEEDAQEVPKTVAVGESTFYFGYDVTLTEETKEIDLPDVVSEYAVLVDMTSGTAVAQKGAKERINPASMTKILTVLVASEMITDLDATVEITTEITDYAYRNGCSVVGFGSGEVVPVIDLFYGTVLPSGADAAVALATYAAGSHEAFVECMNQKLEELGLSETSHFTNCVGLYDEDHYSTVCDIAMILKAAVENDFCREVLSAHTYTTAPTDLHPSGITVSNWFLRRIEDKDSGGLVLCAKTGYVPESKNCSASYQIHEDGTPYICVTAGSSSSWRCIYDQVDIYNAYAGQ